MRNIMLVDFQNLLMIHGHGHRESILDDDPMPLISTLRNVFTDYQQVFKVGSVLFCQEGKNRLNWRKEFWPEYKENRAKSKAKKSEEDKLYISNLFSAANEFMENHVDGDNPAWNRLGFDNTEADDIINIVAINTGNRGKKATIISVDVDYMLLLNVPGVKIYDPRKRHLKTFPHTTTGKVLVESVEDLLELYKFNGQGKDNIFNAKSTAEKKVRFGEKTAQKIIQDPLQRKVFKQEFAVGIKRNDQILNPFRTPQHIQDMIMDGYNNLKWLEKRPKGVSFFDLMKSN